MHHTTTITSVFAALAITGIASAEMIVNLGTVRQIAPRPTIEYSGNFGYAVSSYLDTSATRTVTSFDLNSIVLQIGGDLALTEIRVYDAQVQTSTCSASQALRLKAMWSRVTRAL